MLVLVTYAVADEANGAKRLRRVAKVCKDWGQCVQFSVFECIVDPVQWIELRESLLKEMDLQKDSMRFYFLGANWKNRIGHVGAKKTLDQEGPLIF